MTTGATAVGRLAHPHQAAREQQRNERCWAPEAPLARPMNHGDTISVQRSPFRQAREHRCAEHDHHEGRTEQSTSASAV